MSWFSRFTSFRKDTTAFGPLEWRVLEALWARKTGALVRDLMPAIPDVAYTTLLTTLDRLHRKGVLARTLQGRAHLYEPYLTRAEFESARAAEALRVALQGDTRTLAHLMSFFVRAVGERDRDLLDELEALVQTRRAELDRRAR